MVLYTCCSEDVARTIVQERLKNAGATIVDLNDAAKPQLCEIGWSGQPVDVASSDGIAAVGLPSEYPEAVDKSTTQQMGREWHADGKEGVVCRSASMWRMGQSSWPQPHNSWAEVAIFVERCKTEPELLRRRRDLEWLLPRALR